MKQINELKCAIQALAKRNEKLTTAMNAVSDKADAALVADTADATAMALQIQALRDHVQSDMDQRPIETKRQKTTAYALVQRSED